MRQHFTPIVSLLLLLGACGRPAGGVVTGDVYLVMQSGEVKRGAGNRVRAVPLTDSLRAGILEACEAAQRAAGVLSDSVKSAVLRAERSAYSEARWDAAMALSKELEAFNYIAPVARFLGLQPAAESPTGMEAHYRFDTLSAGPRLLWAQTEIGENHYVWARVVQVPATDSVVADLSNENVLPGDDCQAVARALL